MANPYSTEMKAFFFVGDAVDPIGSAEIGALPPKGTHVIIGGRAYVVSGVCADMDSREAVVYILLGTLPVMDSTWDGAISFGKKHGG